VITDLPENSDGGAEETAGNSLRVELPCVGTPHDPFCTTLYGEVKDRITLEGDTSLHTYEAHVRGVMELKGYGLPDSSQGWCLGQQAAGDVANVYELTAGGTTYHLNCWLPHGSNRACYPFDYTFSFQAHGGEHAELLADSFDPDQMRNEEDGTRAPLIVPDVAPAPAAFDGQFVQVDITTSR
jgi:hypothetical protein